MTGDPIEICVNSRGQICPAYKANDLKRILNRRASQDGIISISPYRLGGGRKIYFSMKAELNNLTQIIM
jgi:hypothetical protein